MRRILLAVSLVVSLPEPVSGQGLLFGPAAGVTSSSLAGDFLTEPNPYQQRAGLAAGIAAELSFAKLIAVAGSALFVQKGARQKPAQSYPTMRITYLEIPLTVRIKAGLSRRLRWFGEGGGAPAIEIACSAEEVGCHNMRTEKVDIGLVAGSGLQLKVLDTWFTLSARYTWGVKNLAGGFPSGEVKNRSILVLLGAAWGAAGS